MFGSHHPIRLIIPTNNHTTVTTITITTIATIFPHHTNNNISTMGNFIFHVLHSRHAAPIDGDWTTDAEFITQRGALASSKRVAEDIFYDARSEFESDSSSEANVPLQEAPREVDPAEMYVTILQLLMQVDLWIDYKIKIRLRVDLGKLDAFYSELVEMRYEAFHAYTLGDVSKLLFIHNTALSVYHSFNSATLRKVGVKNPLFSTSFGPWRVKRHWKKIQEAAKLEFKKGVRLNNVV